jgi:signal transduction histidine kinase
VSGIAALLSAEGVGDIAVSVALVGGGAAAWTRPAARRSAALMLLTGGAWLAGDAVPALLYAHRGPLAHLLLSYPDGRVRSRVAKVVIAAAYVDGLIAPLARAAWPTIALMVAVVAVAAWRWHEASGLERRARAAAFAASAAVGAALAGAAAERIAGANADRAAAAGFEAVVALAATGLAAGLVQERWAGAVVADLVVDLGERHEPQALRAALARTLGDPALEVAYRLGDEGEWVDETGLPVTLPPPGADGRVATIIEDERGPAAALVHDSVALRDSELRSSVAAAVRLAVANARMQAQVAGHVRSLADSRRRLVVAGDEERRRLGSELHGGVEAALDAVAERLEGLVIDRSGEAAAELRRLSGELDEARRDLSSFARGVHPAALTEGGLHAAVAQLAAQAGAERVDVVDGRFAPELEACAYFVCSEALANVAKYATGSRVEVLVARAGAELVVRVRDDGPGGADPACGSGLRGLADRVEALGGSLHIRSALGGGTVVETRLPVS